jgi:pimeloyl-ACP methyl ester carboxylesterase
MATKDVRRSADVDEVKVRDGRVVTVHRLREGGDGARTVVFCHPAPGSGAFDPDPAATAERGVTLIGVDRPGYGGSTPVHDSWATVASAADDIADVLDSLGVGPVGLAGWSAGGRVALALAARRPELVDRVAVVATPAPDEEVSWIPPNEKQMVEAFKGQPPAAVHEQMARAFASMLPQDPIDALPMVGATEQDEATLAAPGTRDRVAGMLATRSSRARRASWPTSPVTPCGPGGSSRRTSRRRRCCCTAGGTPSAASTAAGGGSGCRTPGLSWCPTPGISW